MPNVILEALARGLAILTAEVGANSMLVNSDNGYLISNSSKQLI